MTAQTDLYIKLIEQSLNEFPIPSEPNSLYDPIRYFLNLPGKRIRPVLVLFSLQLFRKPDLADAHAALSTELFHNFSLVHDDMMDKANLRRGFETVHKRWNEETALLAGDALLIFAYDALIAAKTSQLPELIHSFNRMARAVCEGQQLDMDYSKTDRVSLDAYQDMIDRKTGALIAFSFEMGGFLGDADEKDRGALHDFGAAMGRCFQLRDDYLDLFGNVGKTGKARGGDIANCKLTYPILTSLYQDDNLDFVEIWQSNPKQDMDRIIRALNWMEARNIPDRIEEKIESEMAFGLQKLKSLKGDPEAKSQIESLCKVLAYREK